MKKNENELNKKKFLKALQEMSEEKGIDSDTIVRIIKESFAATISKKLENEYSLHPTYAFNRNKNIQKDEVKLSPALVRCEIDLNKGNIDLFHQWLVKKDEDITDDFIEISDTDEKVVAKGLKDGEYYEEPVDFSTFSKADVNYFISNFKQRLSKTEKDNLMQTFSTKIGQIITGTVEKADSHLVIVNLGKTSATLYEKDLIGKEKFRPGDQIKVYIKGIGRDEKDKKSGSIVQISRSCPGFLRRLFENEVHEIYDGTVKIVDVARIPGVRSKVVVTSLDNNVDPSGACIGPSGSRIQAIVSQLGSSKDSSKEKVDVITYHENQALYLAECLKPGIVKGISIDKENSSALAVCEDETATYAIGKGGTNVNLAKRLTGLNEITIKDEKEANDLGLSYFDLDYYLNEEREAERRKNREEAIKKAEEKAKLKAIEDSETPKDIEPIDQSFLTKDEDQDTDISDEESLPTSEKIANTPKVEEPVEEVRNVTTTISLDDLEASLEKEKQMKTPEQPLKKKYYKKDEKQEKSDKPTTESSSLVKDKNVKKMDIYTEEELKAMEDEVQDSDISDEDFSDYDSDDYYEDK